MSAGSSVPMREMTCPSETYSDAFLSRRDGNPNTRYRAIKSETWRWHFRGVVYIFRKHPLFAPANNGYCGTQRRTGASRHRKDGTRRETYFWQLRPEVGRPKATAADKKAGGNESPR